jgi:hypothetical protein
MSLNDLIPPEILNDDLYRSLFYLSANERCTSILEIGSSSGNGSTKALAEGVKINPSSPTLYCLEVSEPRYNALCARYKHNDLVVPYNRSSVRIDQFATPEEVTEFYTKYHTKLNLYPLEDVLGWLKQDVDYLKEHNRNDQGIFEVKWEHGITYFGVVLIDGSEFTGKADLAAVMGATVIVLDDICSFKNSDNHVALLDHPMYRLVEENPSLRNGYSIFRRIGGKG